MQEPTQEKKPVMPELLEEPSTSSDRRIVDVRDVSIQEPNTAGEAFHAGIVRRAINFI